MITLSKSQIESLLHLVAPNFPGIADEVIAEALSLLPDAIRAIEERRKRERGYAVDEAEAKVNEAFDAREPKS